MHIEPPKTSQYYSFSLLQWNNSFQMQTETFLTGDILKHAHVEQGKGHIFCTEIVKAKICDVSDLILHQDK